MLLMINIYMYIMADIITLEPDYSSVLIISIHVWN